MGENAWRIGMLSVEILKQTEMGSQVQVLQVRGSKTKRSAISSNQRTVQKPKLADLREHDG